MIKSTEHTPWPESLAWMASSFKEGTFQATTKFQPDKGPPIVRAAHTPIQTLKGAFPLDTKDWVLLQAMFKEPPHKTYLFPLPHLGRTAVVSFLKVSPDDQSGDTRMVEIELREHRES